MSTRWPAVALASAALVLGCSREREPDTAAAPPVELVQRPAPLERGGQAPAFRIETTAGEVIDSASIFGQRPVVLVFFTTWCPVCDVKMPIVRGAVTSFDPEVLVLGVSIDTEDTWPEVAGFVARHELEFPVVRGREHITFARAYDPTGGIPFVVVIGRDGTIVDAQLGYRPGDGERLLAAVDAARALPRTAPR